MPERRFDCDDRGYFGSKAAPAGAGPFILVAHSFGAMRALAQAPEQCLGMIAINGFDRFQPAASPRIVDRMIAKFDANPIAVLRDFRGRCGENADFGSPRADPLRADLVALRDQDRSAACAAWPTPILALQGSDDPLLPAAIQNTFFAASPLVRRHTIEGGGHLLPATAPELCARAIRAFAGDLG
jgi:pimeloyl-[acyl-carrier protein] methyl ester esterase